MARRVLEREEAVHHHAGVGGAEVPEGVAAPRRDGAVREQVEVVDVGERQRVARVEPLAESIEVRRGVVEVVAGQPRVVGPAAVLEDVEEVADGAEVDGLAHVAHPRVAPGVLAADGLGVVRRGVVREEHREVSEGLP